MSMQGQQCSRRRLVVGGAALWIVATCGYLALEASAAAAFLPGYSYAQNYISDLGMTARGTYSGRVIGSPRAYLMNAAFALQGVFFRAGWARVLELGLGLEIPLTSKLLAHPIGALLIPVGDRRGGPGHSVLRAGLGVGWR